jgi:F0F1-type ATP synthase assembly protein I
VSDDASKSPPKSENETASRAKFMRIAGIGLSIPSSLVAPFILGYFLDNWLRTQPIFFLVCGAAGVISAGVAIIQLWKAAGDA